MLYFSYGSNMSSKRLLDRVPSASFVAVAKLDGHVLRYHKHSKKDGSGKCDIFKTDNPDHFVYGVIFKIDPQEKPDLDRHEGLGYGYEEKTVTVFDSGAKEFEVSTYFATKIEPSLKPLNWYRHHVLYGAREFGLPDDYIEKYLNVDADKDDRFYEEEMAIYK